MRPERSVFHISSLKSTGVQCLVYPVSQQKQAVIVMPPRKSNKSRHEDSDDDSSEEEFVPTQTQSQQYTNSEIQKLAGQVCNLLLVGEMRKIPVKSTDIRKSIIMKKNKSSFQSVMEKAGEMMEHVFGYKIVTVKGTSYILVNTMGDSMVKYQQCSDDEHAARGLLVAILIAIFMSEGRIAQGTLDLYLNAMEVEQATAKPLIQEYLRQKYLEIISEDSGDQPTLMYLWGERAHAEFSKKDILEFACKIYGNDMKPSMWTFQWKIVRDEENKQGQSS